ncbi:MAG: O-antigen/teichoic acid export membrane protein [Gammaproteobacteria bacterium]|jgi:O-antigen/teichoic acid export membrane protein
MPPKNKSGNSIKRNLLSRFIMASGGAAGVSLANFLLALLLLSQVSPKLFGIYGFVHVLIGLGYGVSNAIFGSPLTVALNRVNQTTTGLAQGYITWSFYFGLFSAAFIAAIIIGFGESALTAAVFSLASLLMINRWFWRSYAHAHRQPNQVVTSDCFYTAATLAGAAILLISDTVSITNVTLLQAVGAGLGIIPLCRGAINLSGEMFVAANNTLFFSGFREHGRFALIGVISTEFTANAHVYLVTFLLGPSAYAPLAASVLFFRPVNLVMISLSQLEKPRLAIMLRDHKISDMLRAVSFFRSVIVAVWVGNLVVAFLVAIYFLDIFISPDHNSEIIKQALVFWSVIMGFRVLRNPKSALLQANGDFKALARLMIFVACLTIPLVFIFILSLGSVWSLAGVLGGELLALVLIAQLYERRIKAL